MDSHTVQLKCESDTFLTECSSKNICEDLQVWHLLQIGSMKEIKCINGGLKRNL